ncbi:dTMP kinase [Streptomyces sp. B4I13]|uniref:dTMP kinase n=1 Tax=Streptomyces sp. B4I13 TaxID=3042271 RepID=UPI0027D7C807|nr:dTMP kinase [Streptomyces sp. B4I13]
MDLRQLHRVGKSTTVQVLHDLLAGQGHPVTCTAEPTTTALGAFTRANANHIHGLALACLVAATRSEHIETVIQPALQAGELIVSDRYLPSTLVLQQLDGVPIEFLIDINQHVPLPDLAVILTAEPCRITARIAERGITPRWHLDPTGPDREVDLYRDAAAYLMSQGVQVLLLDNGGSTPSDVARRITDALPALALASIPSPAPSPPQGT